LVNGNHKNIELPPPESLNESLIKKKKRLSGRKKKFENENDKFNIQYPPKFIQTIDRTFSFGDNSFDADNAAYNLYAFVVRIKRF
jgi:hypothetical protein